MPSPDQPTSRPGLHLAYRWLSGPHRGIDTYRAFWHMVRSVQVSQIDAPSAAVVRATLRYVLQDGTVSVERVELGLVLNASTGNLLIDAYRVT